MNKISSRLPLFVAISQLVMIGLPSAKTLAQNPQQNPTKEHFENCVGQMTVQVAQAQAIKGVMQQPNLTQLQKLEQIGKILTPAQKQELKTCMEQPMPAQ
ncbi:MAG: hypothetical protein N5P05_001718 [Chroococcopsis gigantea SAG 12.99]|jgi:hypothetical protein|nr:hypothetical protein [Chlorogloea purpurea SAG 13.99]MDV3000112.1 hypothetical protein [Chroococcopsis gigantea SAG 12.99]